MTSLMTVEDKLGMEALNKLKSTDPPIFLSPNSDLSLTSRLSSKYIFSLLKAYAPKSPLDQLLTDGFDAEQIWQQIDIQSQPLISSLKRDIRRFEKYPEQISSLFGEVGVNGGLERGIKDNGDVEFGEDSEELSDDDDDEGEEDEDEEDEDEVSEDGEMDEGKEEEDESEDEVSEGEGVPEVEDGFLKIKDLEKYLAREEKREYGSEEKNNKKKKGKIVTKAPREDDDEENDDDEGEADEMDNDLLLYGGDVDGDDEGGADIRYGDFFVPGKKTLKHKQPDESGGSEAEDEDDQHEKGNLSTYEKECQKIKTKIKEMEDANLGEKDWTMQGEVTASKRPKDSALEVDLDFDQNRRPPPVITEEVTASLEDIIKKRILEGNFDDVQKAPKLPTKAPKEFKELDDKKSKKGLAEVYEEEYAQQTGLAPAPVSRDSELGNEAIKLFKAICLKLDALSHFHFAPKPVVEEMSIQSNVPALAMEEIAPMAVSDAAMLAPEEIFSGKGDVKEDTELTKEEKKRRRAKKKRKIKAANARKTAERSSKKPKINDEGKEE